jgi:hypothetical protein
MLYYDKNLFLVKKKSCDTSRRCAAFAELSVKRSYEGCAAAPDTEDGHISLEFIP